MITQDDIDAWKIRGWAPEEIEKRIQKEANNLAYEFNEEYLFNLLRFTAEFGSQLPPEVFMKIAYKGRMVHDDENN